MSAGINFDEVIDRRNTDSLKYDFALQRGKPEGILPLWVADMDFKVAPEIERALQKRTAHGIFGYTEVKEEYFQALARWMKERHDWDIQESWIIKTPGVVFALAMAVQAFTNPEDSIIIQQPVYYPFREVIEDNGRTVIDNTLLLDEHKGYRINFEDFEDKIVRHKVKLFLLCNPHNPVGRVWTKEELLRLGDICLRHQVIIVSDEIHQDFVYAGHKHIVFAGLNDALRDITVTCTSPGKTFNLAGLQVSNIFIANSSMRQAFHKKISAAGYSQLNTLGLTACQTAYHMGGRWYGELMKYLQGNLNLIKKYLQIRLPQIKMIEPEGTYLVWLDFRALGLEEKELDELIEKEAELWFDSGKMFGESGRGFQRMNIACPRQVLQKALERLELTVQNC